MSYSDFEDLLFTRGRSLADSDRPGENEPDYRFTLANERTFLAWIRTAFLGVNIERCSLESI